MTTERLSQIFQLLSNQRGVIEEKELLDLLNPQEKHWFEVIQVESE